MMKMHAGCQNKQSETATFSCVSKALALPGFNVKVMSITRNQKSRIPARHITHAETPRRIGWDK
jgi:hypothetical protein